MSWIDGDRWDPERGGELVGLLAAQYHTEPLITQVVQDAGVSLTLLEISGELGIRWLQIAQRVHATRQLRRLTEVVAAKHPQLAAQLAELSSDPTPPSGNPVEVYDVQVLALTQPLIDRKRLRESLRDFMTLEVPVLVIKGEPRTGKSYSFELIRHVTRGQPGLVVRDVDFSKVAMGNSAADRMSKLCLRVGVLDVSGRDTQTTTTRAATELVDAFVGQYVASPGVRRILVFDGLNRTDLKPDVYDMVAQLAVEVFRGNLPQTQLVLTRYSGDFDRAYQFGVLVDEVEKLNDSHLRLYFQHLVLGRKLPEKEVDDLVARAVHGPDGIKDLAQRVRELTIELLQPVGGGA